MNYKLYALLLTLTLAAIPALQAMRLTRGLMATSRSLGSTLQAGKHAFAQTHSTHNNGHGYHQEEPHYGHGNYYIPAAVTAGVVLTALHAMEEKPNNSSTLAKLDIHNVTAILEVFKTGSEEDKQLLATKIAQKITYYSVKDIISLLQHTTGNPHNTLTSALSYNITYYTNDQIIQILKGDPQDDTHNVISRALIENYNYFAGNVILLGWKIKRGSSLGTINYFETIECLQEKYFTTAMQPFLSDLDQEIKQNNFTFLIELLLCTAKSKIKNKKILLETISLKIEDLPFTYAIANFIAQDDIDCQTTAHLKYNFFHALEYIKTVAKNPAYKAAYDQALKRERAISDHSAVFYHSQASPIYWLELLYTKLWEQKYNQKTENYLFTRFPDDFTEFSNAVLHCDGQQKRINLLKTGRKQGYDEIRPYLLFANYAFFGNSKNIGSCSAFYFINSIKIGDPDITTKTIVDKFGDSALFAKYQTQFKQLENEFMDIVQDAVLLQINIPHKVLSDHVYKAAPGGFKNKLIINNELTDDMNIIINTLKTAPSTMTESDEQEFCVVMTPDSVHTLREQGAQVHVYGNFDQEKLNALIAKLEALIARIAKENPQTFAGKMTPTQSYQAYKPVLDDLLQKKD